MVFKGGNSMKLSELAKKLKMSEKELQEKLKELNLSIENLKEKDLKLIKNERIIKIPEILTVREFAEKLNKKSSELILHLMKNGINATINDPIDFDTAAIIADDFGFKVEKLETKPELQISGKKKLLPRPPVVTVMGHVDHGKTTLLDYIRKTNVAEQESGGITQHIGAYQVEVKEVSKISENACRTITFLDTPGHEAFVAMRAHGAKITDIVVLVIDACEGVKPQTIEAKEHAEKAKVPIIVALSKIDKPEANPDRVKRQLEEIGLKPEEWQGDTIVVPLSAKTGEGVNDLLEMILLLAELKGFKASFEGNAKGIVIESKLSVSKGPQATVLVQEGILSEGDPIIIGNQVWGKVRIMQDFTGKKIKEATPSTPVKISGLSSLPTFGDTLEVVSSIKEAKEQIMKNQKSLKAKRIFAGLEPNKERKELNFILKTDVVGSLVAIKDAILNLSDQDIKINFVHEGVGNITHSDIMIAKSSKAKILGFKVDFSPEVKKIADLQKVEVAIYDVIYKLINEISLEINKLRESEEKEEIIGKGEVLKIFMDGKTEKILGVKVIKGCLEKAPSRIVKEEGKFILGKISNLRIINEDQDRVSEGKECGVKFTILENNNKLKIEEGDLIEVVKKVKKS